MTTLQFLRQQRGLSKAEGARLVRMLPVDYSLLERGLQTPSPQQAERLEVAFGHTVSQLLEQVTCPPSAPRHA